MSFPPLDVWGVRGPFAVPCVRLGDGAPALHTDRCTHCACTVPATGSVQARGHTEGPRRFFGYFLTGEKVSSSDWEHNSLDFPFSLCWISHLLNSLINWNLTIRERKLSAMKKAAHGFFRGRCIYVWITAWDQPRPVPCRLRCRCT